ncbi:MAG: PfkB family carbohydrate kinase, partial [Pseudonocardia sp.]|nr:PfkB family carbohydrate kinase [Pseudonocardia sp.]
AAVAAGAPPPGAGCVLVSTEIPGDAVAAAVRAAGRCVLNPAPVIDVVTELLDAGPILTPNRSECLDLAARLGRRAGGRAGGRVSAGPPVPGVAPEVLDAARRLGACTGAPVVVTLGADGALVLDEEGAGVLVAAGAVPVVRDTTGAGDTFNGVLAARLAAGDPLETAVRTAVVAASLSVGEVGARAGMPTAAAVAAAR